MKKKTICIKDGMHIDSLKRALSRCKSNSRIQAKLVFADINEDDNAEVVHLRELCNKLFWALLDSKKCIEKCAQKEVETDLNTIYYDKNGGYNRGARGLLVDVDDILDNYHKEMVDIDLMR